MARVLRLPDHGRLLVCTDLQGCLRDFERIVQIFEQTLLDYQGDAHILFTGDLIHGPHIDPEDWPDFLGEYYRDASGEVIVAYAALAAQYPGRVHALLGNHEHGHNGAPAAQIDSIKDLEAADLSGANYASPLDVLDTPVVGKILWARSATEAEARRFLRAMNGTVAIYGHDVIPEGFETIGDSQMVVSTSFGVFDANKVYVSIDLGAKY